MEIVTDGSTLTSGIFVHEADTTNNTVNANIVSSPADGEVHYFFNTCLDNSNQNVFQINFGTGNVVGGTYTCDNIYLPSGQSMVMVHLGGGLWMSPVDGGGYGTNRRISRPNRR